MMALLLKEIRSFLSSLIGYVVIGVFLLLTGLFMWIFPGELNALDNGYANLDTLFFVAPWVFIFLIPAITMRSFAEEKRTGTLELLLTRPMSDMQIVLAKFLAGVALVFVSLLPTLVFYWSIGVLGNPAWNLDSGGIWGSYIGLFFLGAGYVSIGLFASSVTSNQIVSFLVGAFLCFLVYTGPESMASFEAFGAAENFILKLGMADHYRGMSRGLLDTRDMVYFLCLTGLFLVLTRWAVQRSRS